MYKYTFKAKYKNKDYYNLIGIKFCRYPKKTKLYKKLVQLLNSDIITEFKYYTEYKK